MWARALRLAIIIAASIFLGYLLGTMQAGNGISGPPAQSPFLVSDLSIQPTEARPNELVTVTVTVTNRHHTWGIYSLVLQIDGERAEQKQANVDAGDSQDVSFSVIRKDLGRYRVFINGLSGSFTVVAPTY